MKNKDTQISYPQTYKRPMLNTKTESPLCVSLSLAHSLAHSLALALTLLLSHSRRLSAYASPALLRSHNYSLNCTTTSLLRFVCVATNGRAG